MRSAAFWAEKVWFEPDYPHILFAIDGEIYDFAGRKTLVIGGAYSVDKFYRLDIYGINIPRGLQS